MKNIPIVRVAACLVLFALFSLGWTAKLMEVRPVDDEYLMIYWRDGYIAYRDNGTGSDAFRGGEGESDTAKPYSVALNTATATTTGTYTITSSNDANYGTTGKNPTLVYRKSKVNGVSKVTQVYYLDHWIFLKLPYKMIRNKQYSLSIQSETNSDLLQSTLVFNEFNLTSEALHVNIVGYYPNAPKSADLYMWLGDGGARDYSSYVGKNIILYNVATQQQTTVGQVAFWRAGGADLFGRDLLKTSAWSCDFSSFTSTGTYRLVVEGVGCSPDFKIGNNSYFEPYKTALRGYFYMREGQDSSGGISPVPRRPLWLPNQDPAGFTVYITTLVPGSSDWSTLGSGDNWDVRDWSQFKKPGNPTNPNAWGGWSDACDWDRHEAHASGIWDILLPYILSNGAINEDTLTIAESGNGIPDCIDEARWEVDFWLRLRDGAAYSYGINNPQGTTAYQAGTGTIMAWVNAANAAMLADCFRIAGKTDLMNRYRDSAVAAYNYASAQSDQRLEEALGIGDGSITGRDLKMMCAAYLYNVTGTTLWENTMKDNCTITSSVSSIDAGTSNALYGVAAYLTTKRTVHYQSLFDYMKASIIYEAKDKNANLMAVRTCRRATDEAHGWWQSTQAMQRVCVAHAVATLQSDKDVFMKALVFEADYGLGRNPMNSVQMTGLGSRHAEDIYTTGQNDGTPGVHPGHTPYMNAEDWGNSWWGGQPTFMSSKGYPAWSNWPHGEALWPVRYVYANSEFTPQQTMRGKTCLLAYLHSLSRSGITRSVKSSKSAMLSNSTVMQLSVGSSLHSIRHWAQADKIVLLTANGRLLWSKDVLTDQVSFPSVASGLYLICSMKNNKALQSSFITIH